MKKKYELSKEELILFKNKHTTQLKEFNDIEEGCAEKEDNLSQRCWGNVCVSGTGAKVHGNTSVLGLDNLYLHYPLD